MQWQIPFVDLPSHHKVSHPEVDGGGLTRSYLYRFVFLSYNLADTFPHHSIEDTM